MFRIDRRRPGRLFFQQPVNLGIFRGPVEEIQSGEEFLEDAMDELMLGRLHRRRRATKYMLLSLLQQSDAFKFVDRRLPRTA